jgi:protein TonB
MAGLSVLSKLWGVSTLHWALGVSVGIHAALLTFRFVDPETFNRVMQDTPLEVILVNAKSQEKPTKAQAVAQTHLAGGGDADKGRATSPLPPSMQMSNGDSLEDSQRKVEALQMQQSMLLAQMRKELATLPTPDPKQASESSQTAREEKRRQLMRTLAEIEKRVNEENSRPKKRYISPSTREEVYALYYDSMRRRIEDSGTNNFPELAGVKLYGELTMTLTINHDGRVLETEVIETSGNRTLDKRAQVIARQAGPFEPFNPSMRQKADQLVLVARFKFTREETLETKLASPR